MSKNKTFYVGEGSGSIIFNFQVAAAVERKNKKGRIATFDSFIWNEFIPEWYEFIPEWNEFIPDKNYGIGMNSFRSGIDSYCSGMNS